MNTQTVFSAVGRVAMATAAALLLGTSFGAVAATGSLVKPDELIVDKSLPAKQVQAQTHAARLYDTFWTTGDEAQARDALAADFTDHTLPPGRPQGVAGPLAASKVFHGAVPDVHADVVQMIVTGDRVVSHMRFTGHFTGTFNGVQGKGQPVDFIATDIYRIRDGKIADNWHLEDNLTFLQQLGVVSK
ncbi:ester cyclase [Paraburkholderia silviterrae]|uniref:Ester cyclase n=1 Tax=Paraburkholderia silviterrae TaxID=2528715 RepID=A0A4R5M9U1_9BURK|nr:ester cyclase [Paraburkholderia silviterrae]TDG22757.1 ester cyclase [Paraburkholderia silviterrae]